MLLKKFPLGYTFGMLALASSAAYAQTFSYTITTDTYIDSGVPTYNEGGNTKVKAVDNPASEQFPGSTSTTRALFVLPAAFWTQVDAAIAANEPYTATVNYYYGNNSLAGYSGGHVTGPNPRDVELHPMTNSWVAGTANNTTNAAGSSGATWDTSDGTTPWTNTTEFPTTTYTVSGSTTSYATNVGGDYDIANYVLEQNNNPPANGTFTWDITSLLTNSTTFNELDTYGALLKVTNDTTYDTANDIQYFLSMNSAESSTKPFVTLTIAPEPGSIGLLGMLGAGLLAGRSRRRIESAK
jgi:hypothetical protein